MRTQPLSYDDIVRQSAAIHPDWTPRDHAEYLYTEEIHSSDSDAARWRLARQVVARVLDVTPCHGLPWKDNGRDMPVFVTRGRMAMSRVMDCPDPSCGSTKPIGSTYSAD